MDCVLFEDQYVDDNRPATLARPAFGITCGVANLFDTARILGCNIRTVVRNYLLDVASRSFPAGEIRGGPMLFLNAALIPDVRILRKLLLWAEERRPFLVPSGRRVAAAKRGEG